MQELENDIDDLFSRAAEEYPLHTGRGDWEGVEKKLSVIGSSAVPGKPAKKNNKKLFLLLLLFIISLVIGFMILNPGSKKYFIGKSSTQINQQSLQKNKSVSKNQLTINTSPDKSQTINKIGPADKIVPVDKKKETATENISAERHKTHRAALHNNMNNNIFSNKDPSQFLYNNNYSYKEYINNTNYQKKDNSKSGSAEKYLKTTKDSLSPGNKKDSAELQKEDSLNNDLLSIEKKKTGARKKAPKQNGLYAGIIGGLDYSKVKSTSFKEPGFNLGVVMGYKIKSVFVETVVSRGVKHYSSMGDMFNDHDALMPSGMTIDNLESRSKIVEIPLKAGYYFYRKKKTNLFIAGGVSIYIMTKEKNNYNVTMNGNPEKMV
ncbi:MAG: hypothetical protein ABI280_12800, partial [Ginsengibacter sp.]